ncbi:thiolase family protein [Candidatus Peregrinibacteria bacterium]|nr:thiolase family protein [Candidatus Peregrinibacteria bacterium]
MTQMYIVAGARTPFAKYVGCSKGGMLQKFSAADLGKIASAEAMKRAHIPPEEIDHVILGTVFQVEKDAVYAARNMSLELGIPEHVPALTVQRNCASGMQAIISGALEIIAGKAEVVLSVGAESMSNIPHVVRGMRKNGNFQKFEVNDFLAESLEHEYAKTSMSETAENIAREHNISRDAMDVFAYESHKRAAESYTKGILREEIVPVNIQISGEEVSFDRDDTVRENIDLGALSSLPPAFHPDGTITAGNACGIADGAASVIVASEEYVEKNSLSSLGKIIDWSIVGLDPAYMGLGPVPATQKLLTRTGKNIDEIDLWEINEAFAAQYLGVEKKLGIPREKVNVNGGAIAIGHPLGASGVRLILTLLLELRRRKKRFGIASMCIGGGQGIAVLLEAISE